MSPWILTILFALSELTNVRSQVFSVNDWPAIKQNVVNIGGGEGRYMLLFTQSMWCLERHKTGIQLIFSFTFETNIFTDTNIFLFIVLKNKITKIVLKIVNVVKLQIVLWKSLLTKQTKGICCKHCQYCQWLYF